MKKNVIKVKAIWSTKKERNHDFATQASCWLCFYLLQRKVVSLADWFCTNPEGQAAKKEEEKVVQNCDFNLL